MPKDEFFHVRVNADYKEKVEQRAKELNYETVADFIRFAIDQQLSPENKINSLKDELIALNRRDPEFFRNFFINK